MSARVEIEWLTPLPWADPPFEVVQRIRREVARSIKRPSGGHCIDAWARKVSAEFSRRLEAAGIYVETA